jgi:hypothetical protein
VVITNNVARIALLLLLLFFLHLPIIYFFVVAIFYFGCVRKNWSKMLLRIKFEFVSFRLKMDGLTRLKEID